MNAEQAKAILESIGCRKIRVRETYLMATCPNESAHSGGVDRNPSFRVMVGSDRLSWGNCYACGYSVLLERDFGGDNDGWWPIRQVRPDLEWAPKTVADLGFFGRRKPSGIDEKRALRPFVCKNIKYLADRAFTEETIRRFRLGFDRREQRVVFPIWSIDGRLVGLSGRSIVNEHPKYLHYYYDKGSGTFTARFNRDRPNDMVRFKRNEVLYGEWLEVKGDLVVVEGFTDVLRLWQCGVSAVGIFGATASPVQLEKIVNLADPTGRVVIMGDGDNAGRSVTQSIARALHERLRIYTVNLPDGRDPGDMSCDEILELLRACVFYIDKS